MTTTQQKERQKTNREERKQLEKILHPPYKQGKVEILHEHKRNGTIRFTAWLGNNCISKPKQVVLNRQDILRLQDRKEFEELYSSDLNWLYEV